MKKHCSWETWHFFDAKVVSSFPRFQTNGEPLDCFKRGNSKRTKLVGLKAKIVLFSWVRSIFQKDLAIRIGCYEWSEENFLNLRRLGVKETHVLCRNSIFIRRCKLVSFKIMVTMRCTKTIEGWRRCNLSSKPLTSPPPPQGSKNLPILTSSPRFNK